MRWQESARSHGILVLPLLIGVAVAMGFLARQDQELIGCIALLSLLGVSLICLRPEIGILVFISTFFVTYSDILPATGRLTPNNLLGLLFIVLLILQLYRERDFWVLQEKSVQLFLILIAYSILSSYIAEQRFPTPAGEIDGTSIKLQKHVTRFFFFLFFVHFIRTLRHVKLVLGLLVGIILVSAISALPTTQGYRVAATLGIATAGNANWFAFFCVFGMSIIWFYRQVVQWKLLMLLASTIVGGLAVTVLLTASRSGLLNLILFFTLLTMQGRFSIKQQIQTVLVLVLVVYGATSFLTDSHLERLGNLLPGGSKWLQGSSSTDARVEALTDGLKMIAEQPLFGVGIGNFHWQHFLRTGQALPPHNSYLAIATERGLPALLLYLMIFVYAFKCFRQVEQESTNVELRAIANGLRIGLLLFLSFSLFAEFWSNIITYILIGLAVVLRRLLQQERRVHLPRVALRPKSRIGWT